jgi:hypothetical protein
MKIARLADLASVRAAWWAEREFRRVRRTLRRGGIEAARVTPPPALPARARRGVMAVLRRRPATCLERALVLQSWHAAHGNRRDVVIGIRGPSSSFEAHAWLDGEPDAVASSFEELTRLPAT